MGPNVIVCWQVREVHGPNYWYGIKIKGDLGNHEVQYSPVAVQKGSGLKIEDLSLTTFVGIATFNLRCQPILNVNTAYTLPN